MAKKYNIGKIKVKRSLSFREIAILLEVNTRTVQSWRKEGLKTLEDSKNPYLVMGRDLKTFLANKQSKRKCPLKPNEMYCLKCRRNSVPIKVKEVDNGTIGGNKKSIMFIGVCPRCKTSTNRFSSREGKTQTKWNREYHREHLHTKLLN